jgi:hypothetical protein
LFIRKSLLLQLQATVLNITARLDYTVKAVEQLEKRIDSSVPAVLRADLDDLRAAIEVDRISHRKALGKLWGRIGRDERETPNGPSAELPHVADSELQAYLDLQNAHTRT